MNFLDEIRSYAGEQEKEVKEGTKRANNPNVANKILYNAQLGYVVEMAQQHFDNEVFDLIQQGKYHEAAERYIENQLAKGYKVPKKATSTINKIRQGNFAKGFSASKEKAEEIKDDQWKEFAKAYEKITSEEVTSRERKKTKGTKASTGDTITSVSAISNAKKLRSKTTALRDEYAQLAQKADTEERREEAQAHVDGLNLMLQALENTISGKATLPPDSEKKVQELKNRYKKIGKKYEKKADIPSDDEEDDGDPFSSEEERSAAAQHALRKIRSRLTGMQDPEDIEGLWRNWFERKREIDRQRFGKFKDPDENFSLKGKILSEGLDYRGRNFWKNYIMTSVMKGFAKDLKTLGEDAKTIYMKVYGVETYPIFEFMEENKKILNEVVTLKEPLLFEDYGYNALMERVDAGGGGATEKAGFLKSLWDKVKEFGAPIVSRLSSLIGSGASWAKKIAEKGIGWIANNPVAQVAVPAVVLAGSAVGAISLINRIRKKKGEKKLSKEEKEELKRMSAEKSDEINKYSKKMSQTRAGYPKKAAGEEESDDLDDDEDDLVSDEER